MSRMVPVESVAAVGMRPNCVKPNRFISAIEPALSAKIITHITLSTFFKQFGECVRTDSPALPLRIDIIGEIGDAVVSCAIVENGKRAESNDPPLSVIIYRFRDKHRVRIMMRFNPCFALFVCAWSYIGR